MGERDSYAPGTFCWIDLATPDAAGATAFYAALFGWDPQEPVAEAHGYTMLQLRGRDVAALYEQGEAERSAGVPPHWSSYVSVIDVDESAARVEGLGGKLLAGPYVVFDSGRVCTGSHASVCCSYRRDGAGAGRMAAVIKPRRRP